MIALLVLQAPFLVSYAHTLSAKVPQEAVLEKLDLPTIVTHPAFSSKRMHIAT